MVRSAEGASRTMRPQKGPPASFETAASRPPQDEAE